MFTATLFIIAKTWNQTKCPLDEWIKKMWYRREEWPRRWSGKILSSPHPMGTSKLQLFTEQLLMRKTDRLTEKIFYN